MKFTQLLDDYNIEYMTEGNKHCTPGWINLHCPFCAGSRNYHLGYNIEKNFCTCWRCGVHRTEDVLIALLHVSRREARNLMRQYGGYSSPRPTSIKPRVKNFKFPSNCEQMKKPHRSYLIQRKFNPEQLERDWNLMGAGPISLLDRKYYKHRIIIPIRWGGKIVSFQGRDITGKSEIRYKACPQDRELTPHQTILYGKQETWGDIGICVEGVTDVWRLGFSSFATFGISFTPSQVRNIARHFTRVIILFDDDPQAQEQAKKLMGELRFRGVETWKENIIGDPASLSQEDANILVKELTRRIY